MAASTPTPREEFVYMAKLAEMVEFMEKVSSSIESRGNEDHVAVIRDYRSKIEAKLSNICDEILKLLRL